MSKTIIDLRILLVALVVAIAFALDTTSCFADEAGADKSKQIPNIESSINSNGILYVRDSNMLTTDDSPTYVEAFTLTYPISKAPMEKGFRITVRSKDNDVDDSASCYLDYDEAKALSAALKYLGQLTVDWRGRSDIGSKEAVFKTLGGYSIALTHNADGKHQDAVEIGVEGIHTVAHKCSDAEFLDLASIIDDGLKWLDNRK
jgi:hypothetical protein